MRTFFDHFGGLQLVLMMILWRSNERRSQQYDHCGHYGLSRLLCSGIFVSSCFVHNEFAKKHAHTADQEIDLKIV